MGKAPPPKDFVFSDDDDDQVEGGGIPDDDGMIYLRKGKHGLADSGHPVKRKADAKKPRMVRRSVRRPPKSDS
jgi:hypothetical protein